MNIVKFPVTSANYDVGRGGHAITGIILHTMVGTWQGAQSRFNNPASQVSVQYGVDLGGTIHQWVDEANTAWQAGNYAVNQTTIGIEHEDDGNYNDAVRTPQLYAASSDLVADICKRYSIPCDATHIKRHHDVIDTTKYPGGTACPDGLDTNKIISMAAAKLGGKTVMSPEAVNLGFAIAFNRQATPDEVKYWTGKDPDTFLQTLYNNNAQFRTDGSQYPAVKAQLDAANAKLAGLAKPTQLSKGIYQV